MSLFIGNTAPSKIFVGDTPVNKVFVGDSQVRPTGWQPGANTIAYYPFKDDILDATGNTTLSTYGTPTKQTVGYTLSSNGTGNEVSGSAGTCKFCSLWCKFNSLDNSHSQILGSRGGWITYYSRHADSSINKRYSIFKSSSYSKVTSNNTGIGTGAWHHFAYGLDNGTWTFWLDGQPFFTTASQPYQTTGSFILFSAWASSTTDTADMSDLIIESVSWTSQEIADYYNQTKSFYGISNLQSIQNVITPTITPNINLNDINTNSSGSGNIQSI